MSVRKWEKIQEMLRKIVGGDKVLLPVPFTRPGVDDYSLVKNPPLSGAGRAHRRSRFAGEDLALVSLHRGVINISLHVVGRLEYWNTGYWAKSRNVARFGNIKMPMYLMKLVAVRNPSFHHSR